MKTYDYVKFQDVVIIGSGAAGLTTALSIKKASVLIISEACDPYLSHTAYAQGGVAIAKNEDDIFIHHQDTMASGAQASDPEAVKILVSEGPSVAAWLESHDFFWDKDEEGNYLLGKEGAHSTNRIRHAGGDATGLLLVRHLFKKTQQKKNIQFLFQTRAQKILTDKNGVYGVVVVSQGKIGLIKTRRLVLATGGYSGLYRPTTSPNLNPGDGLMLAAEVGATLRDLEMVQFHPTALNVIQGQLPLLTEALRGAGAFLVDENREPLFIDHPLGSLGPRDIVARAIFSAIQKGHRIFLDATHIKNVEGKFPTVSRLVAEHHFSLANDLLPVTPAAHYTMGGIMVDLLGRTTVSGLWAVGEVSSTGVHGANRLASNSLLECLVFGRRVGQTITDYLAKPILPHYHHFPFNRVSPNSLLKLEMLGKILFKHVGPLRHEHSLLKGLRNISNWLDENQHDFLLSRSGLLAYAIVESALNRRESRGAHFRLDYPNSMLGPYLPSTWNLTQAEKLISVRNSA